MNEYKKCLNCGGEILPPANQCNQCGGGEASVPITKLPLPNQSPHLNYPKTTIAVSLGFALILLFMPSWSGGVVLIINLMSLLGLFGYYFFFEGERLYFETDRAVQLLKRGLPLLKNTSKFLAKFLMEIMRNTPSKRELPKNLAAIVVMGCGGLLVLVSMFMPYRFESPFAEIMGASGNILIQNHPSFLFCFFIAVVACVRFWMTRAESAAWLAVAGGFCWFVWTLFAYHSIKDDHPGSSLWMMGAGALTIAIGGLMLRFGAGATMPKTEQAPVEAQTKTCPKCAETIKTAAVVCRFCGHQFS